MSFQLVRYEQARSALAECQRVDEVKDIRDKAEAMAAYARQARDAELVQMATEIKVRAERRAGEMLRQAADHGDRMKPGEGLKKGNNRPGYDVDTPTLKDIGVTAVQSSRWQQLASIPEAAFEHAVAEAKDTVGQVTTEAMLRVIGKGRPLKKDIDLTAKTKPPQAKAKTGPKAETIREELRAAKERGVSMIETYARLTLSAVRAQDSFTEQERALLAELSEAIAAATA